MSAPPHRHPDQPSPTHGPPGHRHGVDALEHPGILLALLVTVVALPLLVIGRMRTATAMPTTVQVSHVAGPARSHPATSRPGAVVIPPGVATTTTTAPAPTSTTSTTTAPAPTTTTTTAPPPTTATTRPPTTTTAPRRVLRAEAPRTTAPPPAPAPTTNRETGGGTWYRFKRGTCAHKTLPFGTVVHVTDLANGRSTTCVVADRGPYAAGRILDMDPSVFRQLAPLDAGVIRITITW